MKRLIALAALSVIVAGAAHASPAVVFDMGGKFDRSFNQAAYEGAERYKAETGDSYREFEVTNPAQREQALRRMAERGSDPVVGIGFAQAAAMEKVAGEFPETRFTIIDVVVDMPNVQSVVFKEHEGSFLVGMLAAMKSASGKVGFVGGMDIPLIRRFACGYEQGARHVNAEAEVLQNMTGTDPSAWNNPSRGAELARGQFDRGVDVVFAAAGGTGIGVYQAAADAGQYAIGVDSNQNYLQPGVMLTSMLKRVDVAVYEAMRTGASDEWTSGSSVLGLAEGGVDWALDEHNAELITEEMKSAVEAAKASIIAGELAVHDYMSDNTCSY